MVVGANHCGHISSLIIYILCLCACKLAHTHAYKHILIYTREHIYTSICIIIAIQFKHMYFIYIYIYIYIYLMNQKMLAEHNNLNYYSMVQKLQNSLLTRGRMIHGMHYAKMFFSATTTMFLEVA